MRYTFFFCFARASKQTAMVQYSNGSQARERRRWRGTSNSKNSRLANASPSYTSTVPFEVKGEGESDLLTTPTMTTTNAMDACTRWLAGSTRRTAPRSQSRAGGLRAKGTATGPGPSSEPRNCHATATICHQSPLYYKLRGPPRLHYSTVQVQQLPAANDGDHDRVDSDFYAAAVFQLMPLIGNTQKRKKLNKAKCVCMILGAKT